MLCKMAIKMADRRVLCFQTRMNEAENRKLRSVMDADGLGPVIWQRLVMLAVADMPRARRAELLKGK